MDTDLREVPLRDALERIANHPGERFEIAPGVFAESQRWASEMSKSINLEFHCAITFDVVHAVDPVIIDRFEQDHTVTAGQVLAFLGQGKLRRVLEDKL